MAERWRGRSLSLPNSILCCNSVFILGQGRKEKKTHCMSDPGIMNWAVGGSEIKRGHPVSCAEMANRSFSFAVEVCWEEPLQRGLETSVVRS